MYLPHAASHVKVAADLFAAHFADEPSWNMETAAHHSHSVQAKTASDDVKIPKAASSGRKSEKGQTFYQQQRERKSKQRRRHHTVSEDVQTDKLQYRRKQRRIRTSSDSLEYLEADLSGVHLEDKETVVGEGGEAKKKGALLVTSSGKLVASSVFRLKSLVSHLKTAEHAGTSKPKVGLRKLLALNDIVVTHFAAVKNSLKVKSVDVKDTSLVVFTDVVYSDEMFDVLPSVVDGNPPVITVFKEFPHRGSVCSLENILRYVRSRMGITHRVVQHTSELMEAMFPEVTCSRAALPSAAASDMAAAVRTPLSAAFGTYGEVQGNVRHRISSGPLCCDSRLSR